MAMATSSKAHLNADINVTPLVDVVLVLLIIFMVLTPLLQLGYDVNVPPKKTALASEVTSRQQLIVTQVEPGKVYLNREQIDVKQLPLRLSEILKNRNDKTVFFSADDELNYGSVMTTMDIIRTAGAEKIGIITEKVTIPS
ncbi:MAG TPA: biopolymer transporter ExbD [Acidobacteriota bacterium]|jgi:biopolymer transport protein ExbD|nr:biopolymer transporter ExbD [Acidobacteriota bacterium]